MTIPVWLNETLISIAILGVSWIAARMTLYILTRWAPELAKFTESDLDDRIIEAVKKPVYFIIILICLYISNARLPLEPKVKSLADGVVFFFGGCFALSL